jgi:cytochrome P450
MRVPTAPGITQWIPLPYGLLKEFLRDPLGYQLRARERFGDVFRSRIGPTLVHFLYHPDHVRRVLYDHQKNYPRAWHYRLLRSLLGNGLVASEGDHWRRQRRLAQPAFHRQRLGGYAQVMVQATSGMLARWEETAAARSGLDIGGEMSRLTLAIAGLTLFSRDPSQDAGVVGRTFGELACYLEHRFNHPFISLPAWVPTARNRRMKDAARTLNGVVLALIRERRREDRDHGDLLSMLMQARDEETGEAMTEDQVRSEALTFLVAGQETTSTALTWTWFLLGTHPSIRRSVREEVRRVLGDRLPTIEDVPQLIATRMTIEESMRLYPPVWALAREAAQEDEIGGYRIPARSTVMVSPFVTHRHPAFWERPEVFDPDRFTPERVAQRPKGAYFPFLGGPHQCIGNEFAMLEMCLIAAMVLQRFDVELLPDQAIRPKAALTLRPSAPVEVALKRGPPNQALQQTGAACALPAVHSPLGGPGC